MINKQKEILIFSQFYYPAIKAGGPVKSLKLLEKAILKNINFKIFTSKFDIDKSLLDRKEKKYLYTYENFFSFFLVISEILKKKHKYSVFYFNSFFNLKYTILPLIFAKVFLRKKLLIAPRGELFETEFKKKYYKKIFYILFFNIFLKKNIYFHATSIQEKKAINKLFPKNQVKIYPNISDEIDFKPKKKIFGSPYKLVYFSRISKKKNLYETINLLSEINLPVILDIYGNIEDIHYWHKIKIKIKILKKKNKNLKINFKGFVKKNKYRVLKKYPYFILLSDSENFGHSILEAMMSGCIPIISKNSPWQKLNKYNGGLLLNLEDNNVSKKLKFFLLNINNKKYNNIFYNLKKITKIFFEKQKKIKHERLFNLS